MKTMIALSAALIVSYASSAQEETPKKLRFGFHVGTGRTNLVVDADAQNANTYIVDNAFSFRLGLHADYALNNTIHLNPFADLNFSDENVRFVTQSDPYSPGGVLIESGIHGHIYLTKNNLRPYIVIGPTVKIPSTRSGTTTSFGTKTDISIDAGIGLNKRFEIFNFAPELRYSYGLINVNSHPMLQNMYRHSVIFILRFNG